MLKLGSDEAIERGKKIRKLLENDVMESELENIAK